MHLGAVTTMPVEPATLRVTLLGPFKVELGAGELSVPGAKRRALLAMLAVRGGRVVTMETLIDELWGPDLPCEPRNAVHHHVARLRSELGRESIEAYPDGYALRSAIVDTIEFEQLLKAAREAQRAGRSAAAEQLATAALACWQGPALLGLPQTTALQAEAARLEALRVDALEEQIEAALALGRHQDVVATVREAVHENPLRERLWGQLMVAFYWSGRQADALETFREARHVLREELGLEPGPQLQRLQQAILTLDGAVLGAPAEDRQPARMPLAAVPGEGEHSLVQVLRLLREQLRSAEELYREALAAADGIVGMSAHPELELEPAGYAELGQAIG
jgi:DNA-binding SARP family transcriptional activator